MPSFINPRENVSFSLVKNDSIFSFVKKHDNSFCSSFISHLSKKAKLVTELSFAFLM